MHFYSHADGKSPDLKKEYERFATEFKGIFKVGAVNCDESAHLCEKHDAGVVDLPRFRVFPSMPMPPFNLDVRLTNCRVTSNMKNSKRQQPD